MLEIAKSNLLYIDLRIWKFTQNKTDNTAYLGCRASCI